MSGSATEIDVAEATDRIWAPVTVRQDTAGRALTRRARRSRRASSARTSGATSVPNSSIARITSRVARARRR